jgi:hypothetical protein
MYFLEFRRSLERKASWFSGLSNGFVGGGLKSMVHGHGNSDVKLGLKIVPVLVPIAALVAPPKQAEPLPDFSGKTVVEDPISRRFADLDAYLAYLRRRSAIDGAWYREIRPGVYELQTGGNLRLDGGQKARRVFTRDELERKFGFKP